MDSFFITSIFIIVVWMLAGVKITYDQLKLFKVYKNYVDPSFPAAPNDASLLNAASVIRLRLKVIFKKHPDYPEVDRLAKKIRHELALMVLFFIVLVCSSFIVAFFA